MGQWLGALAACPEVLSSIPSAHMVAYIYNSRPVGSEALFWYAYMQTKHIHKNLNKAVTDDWKYCLSCGSK